MSVKSHSLENEQLTSKTHLLNEGSEWKWDIE